QFECLDPVLPVDQVIPAAAVADGRAAHLLRIEGGSKGADPRWVEVALGQRVDPQPGQRHPPQPGPALNPAPDRAAASHRVFSFIWRANLLSARIEQVMAAAQPTAWAGSSAAGSASPRPSASPSRACTVSRTMRAESGRRVRPSTVSARMS